MAHTITNLIGTHYATHPIEIYIRRFPSVSFATDATLTSAGSAATAQLGTGML